MALFREDYSISPARTGDAVVSRLVLTGWSNAPAKLEDGRLYYTVTTASPGVLDLYLDEAKAASDKVATGSIDNTTDKVTLAAANASGITGSAIVVHTVGTEATGEIIVTYAFEDELRTYLKNVTALLDGSSQWEGGVRFESALKIAKRKLDDSLLSRLNRVLPHLADGRHDLSVIAAPGQLAEVHALMTVVILLRNAAASDPTKLDLASDYNKQAKSELDLLKIHLDVDNDDQVDASVYANVGTIIRG